MTIMQIRRGTTAEWAASNPVLASGEEGLDTTLKATKIGDGATTWLTLPFVNTTQGNGSNLFPLDLSATVNGGWAIETTDVPPGSAKAFSTTVNRYIGASSSTGFIPLDENRIYRYSFDIRSTIAGMKSYLSANYKSKTNASLGASPYLSLNNSTVPETWTTYSGLIGLGMTVVPPAGTAGICPLIYANHANGAQGGILLIADFRVIDVTEVVDLVRSSSFLATSALNGAMVAADKTKLDAAAYATGATTLALRSSSGNIQFNSVQLVTQSAGADATRKDYVDTAIINGKNHFNVKDYGAIGDGVADDTAEINAAIAAANGNGIVYYPNGTYKVTSNLVNFWLNSRAGHGKITDGTVTYSIHPQYFGDTNTLWVNSATGNDSNSGLLPGQAFATLSGLDAKLQRLSSEETGRGNWKIRIVGVGPYDGRIFVGLNMFRKNLVFEGDPLVGGAPVTVIDKGATAEQYGMRFEPSNGANIEVKNIYFKNFKVGFNGYGLLMKDLGVLDINDCWAENCDIGFAAVRNVSFGGNNLKVINCKTGYVSVYSSSGTWNLCTVVKGVDSTTGFMASRSAVAHVDYPTVSDMPVAIEVSQNARIGNIGGDFKRNAIVFNAIGGGEYITGVSDTDAEAVPNFYIGTADANTQIYRHRGTGKETRLYGQDATNEYRHQYFYDEINHTGTTAATYLITSATGRQLPAAIFRDSAKKLRLRAFGTLTGTAGTKKIEFWRCNMDGTVTVLFASYTFPAGAVGPFIFEAEVIPYLNNGTDYMGISKAEYSGVAPVLNEITIANASVNATETKMRIRATLGSAADNIKVKGFEVYFQG